MNTENRVKEILSKMSVEDKIALCSGKDFWHIKDFEKYGIEETMMCDGPSGLRKQENKADMLGVNNSVEATCFPAAVTVAQTWNTDLAREIGKAIGEEALEENVAMVLGPGVNIKRNPLCGRNFEYYSEDPLLSGMMGASFINGVQSTGTAACVKHFAANNQEFKRFKSNSIVDERALREIYLKSFETAVKRGKPKAVMCSYNQINGVFSSDNEWLLKDVLRKEWGFDGMVVTDWGAMNSRINAFRAKCDLCMPGGAAFGEKAAVKAYQKGELSIQDIDACAYDVLKFILEQSEVTRAHQGYRFDRENHKETAKKAACEGAVLLQNKNQILPLKKDAKIALIGDMAENIRYQGSGSSHINPTELKQIRDYFPDAICAKGCNEKGEVSEESLAQVRAAAAAAEIVLVIAGLTEIYESEGFDRENMKMPSGHLRMIQEAAKANENTVIVLLGGSAMEVPFAEDVRAILYMGLGGQYTAEAVHDLIYGHSVPSGKLAETWPMKYEDAVSSSYYGSKDAVYRESIYVGYRYYDKAKVNVRYPFGYGLSYTQFAYSNLNVNWPAVTLDVENTGAYDGSETVQLYLGTSLADQFTPVKQLKAFRKVFLRQGEKRTVTFTLDEDDLKEWQNGWRDTERIDTVMIGASSSEIRLSRTFRKCEEKASDHSWYGTLKGIPAESDFEQLYGRKPVQKGTLLPGDFDLNSSLLEMKRYSKLASVIGFATEKVIAQGNGGKADYEDPAFRMPALAALDGSLRSMMISGGGALPEWLAKLIIFEANHSRRL